MPSPQYLNRGQRISSYLRRCSVQRPRVLLSMLVMLIEGFTRPHKQTFRCVPRSWNVGHHLQLLFQLLFQLLVLYYFIFKVIIRILILFIRPFISLRTKVYAYIFIHYNLFIHIHLEVCVHCLSCSTTVLLRIRGVVRTASWRREKRFIKKCS